MLINVEKLVLYELINNISIIKNYNKLLQLFFFKFVNIYIFLNLR